MQVICDGSALGAATLRVIKAISTKTTTPILEGIKLTAEDNKLTLAATDLELGIEVTINGIVKDEGEIVVPGKIFSEFTKKLNNEEVELILDEEKRQLRISYTDSESYFQVLNAIEFPKLKTIDDGEYFSITQKNFKALVNKTVFAVALDDSRPILKGVLLEIVNNNVNAIALDGYRLALIRKPLISSSCDSELIVPAKSLKEISNLLEDNDDEIRIFVERNFMMIEINGTKVLTRLLDGDFINYKQILPTDFTTTITANKLQLEDALDRTSILSRVDRNNLVKFDIKDKLLTLTSTSDIGNIKENISIALKGNDLVIAFNSRYFTESLRVIGEEFVKINFNMPSSPCVITPNEGDEFLYLILPVRIINN